MKKVISVRFKASGKAYYFDPTGFDVKEGDYVVVQTARGTECGEVVAGPRDVPDSQVSRELKPIQRMADSVDVRRMEKNRAVEKAAFELCCERIAAHKLEMKLVEAEYNLDRSKILFYFTADGRVDFRELVKDLASALHTRIELRQIGVRDESKMKGGLGICGQPFCCSRFLKDFQPVSIKMAKEQGLSLNPAKISGACGRLKCCLKYEHEGYQQLEKTMPRRGEWCDTPQGRGRISDRNLLTQKVSVTLESGSVVQFPRAEITIIPPPERSPGASGNRNNARNGGNGSSNDSGREGKNNAAGTEKRDRESRRNAKNNKKRNSGNGNNSNNNSSNGSSNASSQPKQPAPAPAVPAEVPSEPDAGK